MYDVPSDDAEASGAVAPAREGGAVGTRAGIRSPWAVLVCTGRDDMAGSFTDDHACLLREWGLLAMEPLRSAGLVPDDALGMALDGA